MKAIFLDRDGVINDNARPVNKPRDLKLYPWVNDALEIFRSLGYELFVVTNQGGIEAGFFTKSDLCDIHNHLHTSTNNIIKEISYCPHLGNRCKCRKPKSGMIDNLVNKYDIARKKSFMIGDRDVDILAGNRAGVTTIKIGSRYKKADYNVSNLLEAAKLVSDLSKSDNKDSTGDY